MMNVITSKEQFLSELKVGGKFWHLLSWCGKPTAIEGPVELVEVRGSTAVWREPGGRLGEDFIENLTNEWHGVFLSEEDAKSFLEARKLAYERDPKLIAEFERTKREADHWDDDLDQLA